MILYINGDSHAAAAEAVNDYAFAEDDPALFYLGRAPHPANLAVSWGKRLGDVFKAVVHNDSESASSNQRILRTTREWIKQNKAWLKETVMIIQWSTWEREEWQDENATYYQVNASGTDAVPASMESRYKEYVVNVDWNQCTKFWHQEIWEFHLELESLGVKHVFFNGNNDFSKLSEHLDWGISYIAPYDPDFTYTKYLLNQGVQTVAPDSWHFGKDGHSIWSRFMLQYCINNQLMA